MTAGVRQKQIVMSLREQLSLAGFFLQRAVLSTDHRIRLLEVLALEQPLTGRRTNGVQTYAARNLLWERPRLRGILDELGVSNLATEALDVPAFPINALFFDKNSGANWKVPAHQDLLMPVEREEHIPGFTGWTRKGGVPHVEPPVEVLEGLVAVRIHFDACTATGGALSVVPYSHRQGKLRDEALKSLPWNDFVTCVASTGDVLLMKPLLVHRSSPSVDPTHRRVLHVVYAGAEPGGVLHWKHSA